MNCVHEGRTVRTMTKVQLAPMLAVAGGAAGSSWCPITRICHLPGGSPASPTLSCPTCCSRGGCAEAGMPHFGWANTVTAARSSLVGVVTALVATSFTGPDPGAAAGGLAIPALALDAVDGWVARRTHSVSELGARFDMEVDAYLLLVLGAYVAQDLGWWVAPSERSGTSSSPRAGCCRGCGPRCPPRYWRKVVTACCRHRARGRGIRSLPGWVSWTVTLSALGLLLESFGRDVVWLRAAATARGRRRGSFSRVDRAMVESRSEAIAGLGCVSGDREACAGRSDRRRRIGSSAPTGSTSR